MNKMPHLVRLSSVNNFAEWRAVARALLLQGVDPAQVQWADAAQPPDMLSASESPSVRPIEGRRVGRVPSRFIRLAQVAVCHADPARFGLLYGLLWRLQKDRSLMFNVDDTDVSKLSRRVEAVLAEFNRMKGELRFRRAVAADGHKGIAAWFVPKHYVLERVALHFSRAVPDEDWVIATPYRSAFWDRKEVSFGPGRSRG